MRKSTHHAIVLCAAFIDGVYHSILVLLLPQWAAPFSSLWLNVWFTLGPLFGLLVVPWLHYTLIRPLRKGQNMWHVACWSILPSACLGVLAMTAPWPLLYITGILTSLSILSSAFWCLAYEWMKHQCFSIGAMEMATTMGQLLGPWCLVWWSTTLTPRVLFWLMTPVVFSCISFLPHIQQPLFGSSRTSKTISLRLVHLTCCILLFLVYVAGAAVDRILSVWFQTWSFHWISVCLSVCQFLYACMSWIVDRYIPRSQLTLVAFLNGVILGLLFILWHLQPPSLNVSPWWLLLWYTMYGGLFAACLKLMLDTSLGASLFQLASELGSFVGPWCAPRTERVQDFSWWLPIALILCSAGLDLSWVDS